MKVARTRTITMLAYAGLLASNLADAQARGPSPSPRQRADKAVDVVKSSAGESGRVAEISVWLGRLVGRYRIDGSVDQAVGLSETEIGVSIRVSRRVSGAADCRGIGEGAGIHCVINVEWRPISMRGTPPAPAPSEYLTLRPAVLLFGIDSAASGIHVLQVDERSVAISALGLLSEDTLQMETTCSGEIHDPRCKRLVRITAKPASDLIKMEIAIFGGTRLTFNLRREPPP